MLILLIIYLVFLFGYFIFNAYGVLKIWSMRMPNDKTHLAIFAYFLAVAAVITISFIFILTLDWQFNFKGILR